MHRAVVSGPTGIGGYWSETTFADTPTLAHWVQFDFGGGVFQSHKASLRFVRAVRGGL